MKTALALLGVSGVWGADNGKAITPPMGWRSWNLYGAKVDQGLIEGIMDGMVARKRMVDGKLTSLCDLGYCDVGLDDNWQKCGAGAGTSFHDVDGNPIVNLDLFPDFNKMTDHAHSLGLTAGWYGNNCICREFATGAKKYYQGDVTALHAYGFDAVKLDGCGAQTDLQLYYELMNATGKAYTIENCHWGSKVPFEPNATWCPWNFYRTSGDVRAKYSSIVANLQTTIKYANSGLSKPGCWAYPDMLEVGCAHGPGGVADPGLTPEETRAHFASWAIVSSPLTLSHDVNNDTLTDLIWPVIANPEIIAVNQAWHGHSGSPFSSSSELIELDSVNYAAMPRDDKDAVTGATIAPATQYFYKPIDATHTAVLLMNHGLVKKDLTFKLADVPGLSCAAAGCQVRDIFDRKDIAQASGSYTASGVASHDAAFLMLSNV